MLKALCLCLEFLGCDFHFLISDKNLWKKHPIESAVVLNKERGVIRGVDCRTLGALGMPLPRLR